MQLANVKNIKKIEILKIFEILKYSEGPSKNCLENVAENHEIS